MEEHLLPVWSDVTNVEGVCNFTFASPTSAIIAESCGYIGI